MKRLEKARLTADRKAAREKAQAELHAWIRVVYAAEKSIPRTALKLKISERSLHRHLAKFPDLKKDAQAGRALGRDGRPKRVSQKEREPK